MTDLHLIHDQTAERRAEILRDAEQAAQEPPVDGGALLAEVLAFIRRFIVITDMQAVALSLWVAHTHAFSAADTTPYVTIVSAEKRSGKSRLLEVLGLLVASPLPTANISDAALFRAIEQLEPTLLFDEIDAIFGPKARDREDLRGMLNAGFQRGAHVHRMGGAKMTTLEAFPVFAAKVFAGIEAAGKAVPDTITDRSILVRLERKTAEEKIERFRRRDVTPQAGALRQRVASHWSKRVDRLRTAEPSFPGGLDDRAEDVWEPLLAIADDARGDWPERARAAAVELSGAQARRDEDESLGVKLLADIQQVFEETGVEHVRTADLIAGLCKIEESPWGDWRGPRGFTGHALSKILKPYRIQTMPVWVDGGTVRGYKRDQFANAFHRYPQTSVRSVRSVRSEATSGAVPNAPNAPNASYAVAPADGDDDDLPF